MLCVNRPLDGAVTHNTAVKVTMAVQTSDDTGINSVLRLTKKPVTVLYVSNTLQSTSPPSWR
jgi:hypothetical protein